MSPPEVKKEMRWSVWKQMKAEEMLKHLKSVVFPQLASTWTGQVGESERQDVGAQFPRQCGIECYNTFTFTD